MTRIKELDGLRTLAFLGVFQSHLGVYFQGGTLGVDVFLVLSAYLLATRLLREREGTGEVDVRRFYLRRIRRIWPLYFVFLGAALLAWPGDLRYALPTAFFVSNFAIAWTTQLPAVIGPMWSTGLEEQFYATVPWLVRGRRALQRAAVLLLVLAMLGRVLAFYFLHNDYFWSWYVFRWDPLALGLLLATARKLPSLKAPARWTLLVAGVAAGMALAGPFVQRPNLWSQPVMALGAGLIVLAAVSGRDAVLGNRVFAWLGERTYGMYLFHLGMLYLLPWPLALAATIALAALSYRFLERPVLDYQPRPRAPAVETAVS